MNFFAVQKIFFKKKTEFLKPLGFVRNLSHAQNGT
jgi:hypothetical protein